MERIFLPKKQSRFDSVNASVSFFTPFLLPPTQIKSLKDLLSLNAFSCAYHFLMIVIAKSKKYAMPTRLSGFSCFQVMRLMTTPNVESLYTPTVKN